MTDRGRIAFVNDFNANLNASFADVSTWVENLLEIMTSLGIKALLIFLIVVLVFLIINFTTLTIVTILLRNLHNVGATIGYFAPTGTIMPWLIR